MASSSPSSGSSTANQIIPPINNDDSEIGAAGTASPMPTMNKVMSSVANLAQLMPTGTVLTYQALAPSFTNYGKCETSNQWLTTALVAVLASACLFFSFTDSVVGRRDGKLYYGFATLRGFNVFNLSSEEEKQEWNDLNQFRRLRVQPLDFMHAFFTAVVFLTMAFSDVGLQNCFFPDGSRNTQQLLKNLPLGMAFLFSFVFIIFPTKRKGIGFNDTTPRKKLVHPLNKIHPLTNEDDNEITAARTAPPMTTKGPAPATVMSSVANLAQLLPTGTVLAYQALSPSFTNHGKCESSNQWLSGTLVAVLASACLFFSFTDSIVGRRDGKLYYGFATLRGFNVFNFSSEEESDVGLQNCFFPDANRNTEELLKNLPMGMAFLSSFVFIMFPTKRKSIEFSDNAPPQKVVHPLT
ncbi:hypothetical protein VPH35_034193 [Triticum aestivum]